ncbi:MAG: prepilin peptidase [Planctomycetota bacterium]|nr:prepilin peptidase [Planctomycetota bacterium]
MEWVWLIFLLLLGACVGSFMNVLIHRLPRGESIVFPPSHCPACGRGIKWYDNIPVLSWLLLGGRCRFCREPISCRYLLVELAAAVLVGGLYVWYFMLDLRQGAGEFAEAWPMFTAHAALLCGLLVCSIVDIRQWIIPLEVMWFCSLLGLAAAAYQPHAFLPAVSPNLAAMSFAAAAGLAVANLMMRRGLIQPSFIDASDRSMPQAGDPESISPDKKTPGRGQKPPVSVAITKAHGVNPRKEVLRECLFLAPVVVLAVGAAVLLVAVPAVGRVWRDWLDVKLHPILAPRVLGAATVVFGYFIGGLWIWAARIFGTLAFGKEAMGLGDVHIFAAVGAVTGAAVPSVAFFMAPFFALSWAMVFWLSRRQRELPYGPWLAAATLVVMLFYDSIMNMSLLRPYIEAAGLIFNR